MKQSVRCAMISFGLLLYNFSGTVQAGGTYELLDINNPYLSFATIPQASVTPTIDGKCEKGEWDDAVKITGFVSHLMNGLSPRQSHAYMKYDSKFLYVIFVNDRSENEKIKTTKSDDLLWFDNSCEVTISPDSQTCEPFYRIIGNTGGYIHDSKMMDTKWQSNTQCAGSVEPSQWIVEMAIPLSAIESLPYPVEGIFWKLNLRVYRQSFDVNRSEWVTSDRMHFRSKYYPFVQFGGKKHANVESFIFENDILKARVRGCGTSIIVETCSEQEGEIITSQKLKSDPDGIVTIEQKIPKVGPTNIFLRVTDKEGRLLARHIVQEHPVAGQLGLKPVLTDPFRKLVLVRAAPKIADVTRMHLVLKNGNSQVIFEKDAVADKQGHFREELSVDVFNVPKYVEATVIAYDEHGKELGQETSRLKTFPKPKWFSEPEGVKDFVPKPWHNLLVWKNDSWSCADGKDIAAEKTVSVGDARRISTDYGRPPIAPRGELVRTWQRDYDFGSTAGTLLEQITILGEPALAEPVKFVVVKDGKSIEWTYKDKKVNFTDSRYTHLETLQAGGFTVDIKTELAYDGFIWFDINLTSAQKSTISGLYIDIPVKKEIAEIYNGMKPANSTESTISGKLPQNGQMRFEFCGALNITNDRKGIGFIGGSSSLFRSADPFKPLSIDMNSDLCLLRIHIADEPVVIKKPLHITFGLQSYPLKPWPKTGNIPRIVNGNESWYNFKDADFDKLAESKPDVVMLGNDWWMSSLESYVADEPEKLKTIVSQLHRRGIKAILYSYRAIGDRVPEFRFYQWPWLGEDIPGWGDVWRTGEYIQRSYGASVKPEDHWVDFLLGSCAEVIHQTGMDGLYLDCTYIPAYDTYSCEPDQMVDFAKNKGIGTWKIHESRVLAERLYKMVMSHCDDGVVEEHTLGAFCGHNMGFQTHTMPGESLAAKLRNNRTKTIPSELMRSILGQPYGVPTVFYTYNLYAQGLMSRDQAAGVAAVHGMSSQGYFRSDGVSAYTVPMFDVADIVSDATLIPYWDANCPVVVQGTDDVKASCYTKEGKIVAVIATNLSDKDCPSFVLSSNKPYIWKSSDAKKIEGSGTTLNVNLSAGQWRVFRLEQEKVNTP